MVKAVVKRKADDLTSTGLAKINDAYYTALGNAVSRVLQSDAFKDMRSKAPLTITHGGSREAFKKESFRTALKKDDY
eukprot:843865-Pyramimonas_sp.AAC.1